MDDALTYNYEKGEYATIDIKWNDEQRSLKLSGIKGISGIVPDFGTFKVRMFSPDGIVETFIEYDGKEVVKRL